MNSDANVIALSGDRSGPDSSASFASLPAQDGANDTRMRILAAGLDLFAAQGYHATSIRDIAAGAGLQSASLYTHFTSKEAILAELVLIAFELHHRALISSLLTAGTAPRDQFRNVVEAHVAAHCRWSKLAAVATHEMPHLSPESAAPAIALRASQEALVSEIVRNGLDQGVFKMNDVDITMSAIASLGIAVINWYPSRAGEYSPEKVGATYAELALAMVGAGT
jgi:AcrR family transcriptional regulator